MNLWSAGGLVWSVNVTCGGPLFPNVNYTSTAGASGQCSPPSGNPQTAGSALAYGGAYTPMLLLDVLRVYALSWVAAISTAPGVPPYTYTAYLTALDLATGNVIWTSPLALFTAAAATSSNVPTVGISLLSSNIWVGVFSNYEVFNGTTIVVSPVDGTIVANVTGTAATEAIPYNLASFGPQPLVSNAGKVLIHLAGARGVEAYDVSKAPTPGLLPLWSNAAVLVRSDIGIPLIMDDIGVDGAVLLYVAVDVQAYVGFDVKKGTPLFNFSLPNTATSLAPTFAYDGAGTLWVSYVTLADFNYALAVATYAITADAPPAPIANITLPCIGAISASDVINIAVDKSGQLAYVTYSRYVYPAQPAIFTVSASADTLQVVAKTAVPDVASLDAVPGPVDGQLLVFQKNTAGTLPSTLIYQ